MCKQNALDDCKYCRVHPDKVAAAEKAASESQKQANDVANDVNEVNEVNQVNQVDDNVPAANPESNQSQSPTASTSNVEDDFVGLAMPPMPPAYLPNPVHDEVHANVPMSIDASDASDVSDVSDTTAPVVRVNDVVQGMKRRIIEVSDSIDNPTSDVVRLQADLTKLVALVEALEARIQQQPQRPKTTRNANAKDGPPSERAIMRRAQSLFYREFKQRCPEVIADMTRKAVIAGLLEQGGKLPWGNIKIASNAEFTKLADTDRMMYLSMAKETIEKNLKI